MLTAEAASAPAEPATVPSRPVAAVVSVRDLRKSYGEFEAQPRAEGAGVFPFEALRFGIELMEWIAAWYADLERRLEATPAGARPSPQEGTAAPPHR